MLFLETSLCYLFFICFFLLFVCFFVFFVCPPLVNRAIKMAEMYFHVKSVFTPEPWVAVPILALEKNGFVALSTLSELDL